MKKLFIAGIAAALLSSAPAIGADMPVKAVADPLFNWTGWYLGGNGGYSWGRVKQTFTSTVGSYDSTTKVRGVEASVEGGYCWQNGTYVYCGEIRFDFPHERGHVTNPGTPGTPIPTDTDDGIATYLIGPKLGFVTDANRTFWYGAGGVALDDAKSRTSIPGDTAAGSVTKWRAGFFVGAGVERMIDRHWSWKLQYDLEYFGSGGFNYTLSPCAGSTRCPSGTSPVVSVGKAYDSIISAGINYHFGTH